MTHKLSAFSLARALALIALLAPRLDAQPAPNAGELLQQTAPRPVAPPAPPQASPLTAAETPPADPGTDRTPIAIRTLVITGNTVIPTAELRPLIASAEGRVLTLAELRALADRVTQAYVDRGYLLARAYLPAQEIKDGTVTLAIQEGRLGAVRLDNTSHVADPALRRFFAPLTPGEVVAAAPLEGALLRLRDLPGQQSAATLEPGAEPGTADLVVSAAPSRRLSGQLTLDNSGGASTGEFRLGANAEIASPFRRGDRLAVQALTSLESGQNLRYGRAAYDLPLDGDGLRLGAAYSHLTYELGQNFKVLDANGTADVAELWLARPLLRSRRASADARLGYEFRDLDDRVDATSTRNPRHLHTASAGLSASRADAFLGGGLASGGLTLTYTDVDIRDQTAASADAATARTAGGSAKLELHLERTQALAGDLSLYLRAAGQASDGNLDSGDQTGASGPSAVRAYPQGELYGDQAALFTAELRHPLPLPSATGVWQAVLFYDTATVWIARDPWTVGDNRRTLAGPGAGLRWQHRQAWTARLDAAWRSTGGDPQAAGAHSPQIWASLGYAF